MGLSILNRNVMKLNVMPQANEYHLIIHASGEKMELPS